MREWDKVFTRIRDNILSSSFQDHKIAYVQMMDVVRNKV